LLGAVTARQAELVARWLLVGFIHGVMNTDNTSISGETIDYGPCAFMDHYDPATVFSSIDELGRYAYANQPRIALWNLTRLAECLVPLFSDDQEKAVAEAQEVLGAFGDNFNDAYKAGLRNKLGLFTEREDDQALAQALLDAMAKGKADFTLTFRRLSDAAEGSGGSGSPGRRNRRPSGGRRCAPSIPPSSRATTASRPSSRQPLPMTTTPCSKSS
jgi:uncharacterized protein YdiU (UPF0061 family)